MEESQQDYSLNHLALDATRNEADGDALAGKSLNHLALDATRNRGIMVGDMNKSLNHLALDATRNHDNVHDSP